MPKTRIPDRLVYLTAVSWVLFGLMGSRVASAAEIYEITSTRKDGKVVKYEVTFGSSKTTNRLTAFCPKNKKFVYLTWKDDGKTDPKPVSYIWDSGSGETIPLYRFPGSPYPLPAIRWPEAMKVCPITGDKKFRKRIIGFGD
jgi:hypothetical protein